jgi:hypothetical protein
MSHPIFKEYSVMDAITKAMVKEMPIQRGEMLYLMELDSQSNLFLGLMGFGVAGAILCVLLTFV